jgi:predicted AAA+ superfamily ATPase
MIPRIVTNDIRKRLNEGKALIILGARQVGKTTLLQKLVGEDPNVLFLNGDEPDTKELLSSVTSTRLEQLFAKKRTIVIDEAQMIPEIGITLKLITDKLKGYRLLVSGSSSIELANTVNEPLTGRKYEYQLFPISFREMVDHHGLIEEKRMLPHRMVFGYYPEVVISPGNEINLLKNLAGSYLYKDILSFGLIKKPVILDKLLKALALQIGSEVSFAELGQLLGADKETIERYVDLLEKAFIVFRLNAFSRNVRNEIKKGKKFYFYDNGIRNALTGNYLAWENRTDKGPLWENFVISERIKQLGYSNFYGNYYFWRTRQQQEIDFIEEKDGKFTAFEFKVNPRKKARLPITFSKSYPVSIFREINPGNLEEILLD